MDTATAATARTTTPHLEHPDVFVRRHVGPRPEEIQAMLKALGVPSLSALMDETVPKAIRRKQPLALAPAR